MSYSIATTICTQCGTFLEPGSKQCGQSYSPGEPMRLRSWDTQDAQNEWRVVRTDIPVKCFEAARNERGNVRWPKDSDAMVTVVEIDAPSSVRAAPAALRERIIERIVEVAPVAPSEEDEPLLFPPDPGFAKLSDFGDVGEGSAIITKEEVDGLLSMDEAAAAEAVKAMKGDRRKRFTELLHAELSELRNRRGMAGENLKREADIEGLLGLFARLGEV